MPINTKNSQSTQIELFVGGIEPSTTRDELVFEISKIAQISSLTLVKDHSTGLNKGYAFFTAAKAEDIATLLSCSFRARGRSLHCQLKQGTSIFNSDRRVFIGGLPKVHISNEYLVQKLSVFGTVRSAYPIKDINGICKGFGFVDFHEVSSAMHAIKNSGSFTLCGELVEFEKFSNNSSKNNSEKCEKNFKKYPSKIMDSFPSKRSRKSCSGCYKNSINQACICLHLQKAHERYLKPIILQREGPASFWGRNFKEENLSRRNPLIRRIAKKSEEFIDATVKNYRFNQLY